jgi:hypothetical protein
MFRPEIVRNKNKENPVMCAEELILLTAKAVLETKPVCDPDR